MTSSETVAAQQPGIAGELLESVNSAWLPLTTGDSVRGADAKAPEHEWPASIFIFLAKLVAIGCGIGAAVFAIATVVSLLAGELGVAGLAALGTVALAVGCVLQGTLAKHVEHFSRWGWWGAMAELALATLSKVSVVVQEPSSIGTVGFGIIIDVMWMRYFWNRRADFDIDFDL